MAWDLIVMPLSRSRSIVCRTCARRISFFDGMRFLKQAVGEGGLAVVYVGYYGKIAYL